MPAARHVETHFTASGTVRDIVIGMSDGLTVPFALAAGLSGAVDNPHIIVTAGMAEIVAGAIAMGLGGHSYSNYREANDNRMAAMPAHGSSSRASGLRGVQRL